ncbi:YybS family protein [Alkalicoccus luteus]|uniref:YybS family protein n=1 Tax=Alkalicoccus luteus TaxID=1237094 RepID=UPI0040331D7C
MMDQHIIKDGAVAALAFTALVFASLLIPFLLLVLIFFLPIPLVLFTYKYGWKAGSVSALAAFTILLLLIGPLAPPVLLLFMISGIVIGELYRRGEPAFGVYAGAALSIIGGIVLTYAGVMALTDADPVGQFQTVMEESLDSTGGVLGLDPAEEEEAVDLMMAFIDGLSVIVPAIMVITGGIVALITQLTSAWMLRKRSADIPGFPPLREWSLPKSFIWYYLIVLILSFINRSEGGEGTLNLLSENLMAVMGLLMVVQGIAFLFFFFHLKRLSIVLPVLITLTMVVFPFMLPIIRILGIIDLGFDLRTRLQSQR